MSMQRAVFIGATAAFVLTVAVLIDQSSRVSAQAQDPAGQVNYGNPPPPHCAPDENGVTKDGRACGVGPITAYPLSQNKTMEDFEREVQWEQEQRRQYYDANPEKCAMATWAHDLCVLNPLACANVGGGGPTKEPDRRDATWTDENHVNYRVDPDTGAILEKIVPETPHGSKEK